jgi:hypothetical protein
MTRYLYTLFPLFVAGVVGWLWYAGIRSYNRTLDWHQAVEEAHVNRFLEFLRHMRWMVENRNKA